MRVQHKVTKEYATAFQIKRPADVVWDIIYDSDQDEVPFRYSDMGFKEWFTELPAAKYTLKLDTNNKVAGIANDDRDNVNSPKHYTSGHVETIYAIENVLGPEGFKAYCMGNYMKYMARHQHKNGEEDLKKAQVYLNWLTNGLPAPVNGKLPK